MSLTSDGEKILLWAKKEHCQQLEDEIFTKYDSSAKSYFEKRDNNDELIYEYGYSNLPELKEQLLEMWDNEKFMREMITISAVATMKHKPKEEHKTLRLEHVNEQSENEIEIPEYVYVF